MGNFVCKGTMQWETLAHEGHLGKGNLFTQWAYTGHIDIGTRWAHSRHIDIGNFAHDGHKRWATWVHG